MPAATLEELNEAFAIEGALRFEAGTGGLPRGVVSSSTCAGEFYLHGAHVTQWRPAGHGEVLWMSPTANFGAGRAIRGGIPICFPWFGSHPDDPGAPSHGVARTRSWELRATQRAGNAIEVEIETEIEPWACRLTASFADVLTIALDVRNASDADATFEAALHTYLAVSDIEAVSIAGLEDAPFIDMADGRAHREAEGAPLRLSGEVDRLYPHRAGLVTVRDQSRLIEVQGDGSRSTVVWNPGPDRAAQLSDLADGWRRMVCVETANVADNRVMLSPGEAWRVSTTIVPVATAAARQ